MLEELRRMALFTSGVAELSRNRAEQMVKGLVKSGDVRREQASTWVKNMLELSSQNRKELLGLVRTEIRGQIAKAGFATRRDLERLERRIVRLEDHLKKVSAKQTAARQTPAKKTTAKKTAAKKTAARPSGEG